MKNTLRRSCYFRALCVACTLACFCDTFNAMATDEPIGALASNIQMEVEKGEPLEFEVWLSPRSPDFNGIVKVFMERSAKVKYEPQEFELKAGERQKVIGKIVSSNSGLAVIYAYAEHWEPINLTINSGFTGKLKTNISEPLQSRTVKGLALSLVDKDGKPVKLDAPLELYLRGTQILLWAENPDHWRDDVVMGVNMGTSNLMPINIKPTSWAADTGIVSVLLRTPQGAPVYDETVYVSILPPWYVPLFMAMLGGLGYSFGQFLRAQLARTRRQALRTLLAQAAISVLAGLTAGLLAYLLAAWNILGIKIDTTSLKGFVILGFLFSYVGVDLVLGATGARKPRSS